MKTAWDEYLDRAGPERRIQILSWYNLRPPAVQAMVREYPPGTAFEVNGRQAWVVSYVEPDEDGQGAGYSLSYVDPAVNYHGALMARFFVHADCLKADGVCVH